MTKYTVCHSLYNYTCLENPVISTFPQLKNNYLYEDVYVDTWKNQVRSAKRKMCKPWAAVHV